MPETRISLDRLLESCHRHRASDVLIAPAAPVLIRLPEAWRELQTLAAEPADIERMCRELFVGDRVVHESGYTAVDFAFGDVARFRATAFGYPDTRVLLIARYPEDADNADDDSPSLPAAV